MRLKIIAIIMVIVAGITALSLFTSLYFTRKSLAQAAEGELTLVSGLAAELIQKEIETLKDRALLFADTTAGFTSNEAFSAYFENQPEHGGLLAAIVYDEKGIIYQWNARPQTFSSDFLGRALAGEALFSTTEVNTALETQGDAAVPGGGTLVNWIAVPAPQTAGSGNAGARAFAAAIPGTHLRDILDKYKIWESGNVYVLDNEGVIVANTRLYIVHERWDFVHDEAILAAYPDAAKMAALMIANENGIARYHWDNAIRIGAYNRIPGTDNWSVGAVAPLNESPLHKAEQLQAVGAVIFLLLGLIAAFHSSFILEKPYRRLEGQRLELENMVKIAEDATRSKSLFLANISHEIRTPMNAIIGMSDLMPTGNLTPLQKGYIEDIKKMSKSLLQIINDLLDFSKIETGKLDLIPVHYNFWSLFDNVCSISKFIGNSKNIDVESRIDANVPQILFGDEVRVRQIITNVLSNAVKYTQTGGVYARVQWTADGRETGKGTLLISVKDTGIGIKDDDRVKLFRAFEQLDLKKNRGITGTGLGLTIASQLLKMMDGTIDFDSVYGKGTTFYIHIPTGTGDKMQVDMLDLKEQYVMVKTGEHVKVLVVDDMPVNLTVASGFLFKHNINAETAQSGAEAVNMACHKQYDLIFMDHLMPEMDGLEATRLIRSTEGSLAKWNRAVPIIALSANAIIGARSLFLEAGMDDFISKPIEAPALNSILNKYLPLEKIERVSALNEPPHEHVPEKTIDLPPVKGVNYAAGFNRFGEKYTYLDIIRTFVENTPSLLQKIEHWTEMDIKEYQIAVHGIKGSARAIGAEIVAALAADLESAAAGGKTEFITAHNEQFTAELKELTANLQALVNERSAAKVKEKRPGPAFETLEKIREACVDYDSASAESLFANLYDFEYESGGDFI
ncbi:MAG: response regulator, partial [Spirochaetaceae bacterium]|nr:response regulator [Spirochaetaceae bacterium]